MKIVHGQNTDRAIKFPIFQGPKAIMAWSSQIAHMTFFQIGAQNSHPNGGPYAGRKHVDVRLDCQCSRIGDLLQLRRIVLGRRN